MVEPEDLLQDIAETDCGVLPLLAVACIVAADRVRADNELKSLLPLCEEVASAQDSFHSNKGRYATSLWELRSAALIDQQTSYGISKGYIYSINSDGKDWHMDLRRESDKAEFLYHPGDRIVPMPAASGGAASSR